MKRTPQNSGDDTKKKLTEKLDGWYHIDEDEVQLELEAELTQNMEINATGKNRAGKEFEFFFGRMHEEWVPVEFPEYKPFCPFKLDHTVMNNRHMIERGKGTTQGGAFSDKFKLTVAPGF